MALWIVLAAAGLLLALFAACWWGSEIVFHPPRMLPNAVFPEQFALPYTKAAFSSPDGIALRGWVIPAAEQTDRTILLCHGWGDNKGDILRRFHFLAKRFNLFVFDTRHHGESGGEISTIGALESRDFAAAVEWLRREHPVWTRRLGLLGLSMGAAIAVRGLAEHGGFRCALLESPFRSFNRVVRQFCTNAYKLPYFPFVWLTLLIIRWRVGEDPEPYSPIFHAPRMPAVPLFFVAGEKDALMPREEVEAVYRVAPEPKQLWTVPEGTHGRCQEAAPEEYARRVSEFFERHV